MELPILIEVDQLNELVKNDAVIVIDTRSGEEFSQGHVPGSRNIRSLFTCLLREDEGGFPELVETLKADLEQAGVTNDSRLVFVEDAMNNGYGQSCRAWLLLNYFGHYQAQVLHGGYRAWVSANKTVSTDLMSYSPTKFIVNLNDHFMISKAEMFARLDSSAVILDCRDQAEWVGASSSPYGIDFCPRKGRIPNAKWLEWYDLMEWREGIPFLKPEDQLRNVFQDLGIEQDDEVIIYCFKGARASNVLVSMLMAGYSNVRNYFGSWNDWSRDFEMPIDDMFKY